MGRSFSNLEEASMGGPTPSPLSSLASLLVGLRKAIIHAPLTSALALLLIALNTGSWAPNIALALEFNRTMLAEGEAWRLITGNLVHWSPSHFLLDLGAFLVVGYLFESRFRRGVYALTLLTAMASVGLSIWWLAPDTSYYRGFSGVDSGQFAAAVALALIAAKNRDERTLYGLAAAILILKLAYESTTGALFLPTESLGYLGEPMPLSHVAGTAGALIGWGMGMLLSKQNLRNDS